IYVRATASNSLANCLSVAAHFKTTCGSTTVPVANINATTGTNVTCASLSGTLCPGTVVFGSCVFQHKLCVTCYTSGSTVKIRVQSNGLPLFCPSIPSGTFSELNVDYEVNFNPDVSVSSPNVNVATRSALSSIVCDINSQSSAPSASAYVQHGSTNLGTVAGTSIDGVSIMNVNNAMDVDPFFPAGGNTAEMVDSCLAHCQVTGIYHYHIGSGCALYGSNLATYSVTQFTNYRTLTVIGIAKDGHVIYGPYDSTGTQVTSGFDVCNGMFYDSIGNYGYFATQTFPYLTGCFGPNMVEPVPTGLGPGPTLELRCVSVEA
ncbi:unnamed protein product, partial [Didymodactylos carnosus]